ncbi:hypothetical protein V5O48_019525, partial [Marasmius crinis-equi]
TVKKRVEATLEDDEKNFYHGASLKVFQDQYGYKVMAQFSGYRPVEQQTVEMFINNKHPGPEKSTLMYFGPNHTSSQWNKQVVKNLREIAMPKMKEQAEEEKREWKQPSDQYVEALLHARMVAAASAWNLYRPNFDFALGRMETDAEALSRGSTQEAASQISKTLRSARER